MSDRRYSTARWQRLRKAVLARDGYVCQIQGPTCTLRANTVHHIEPSSQRPDLFWATENLASACAACNYSGGAYLAAGNRRAANEQIAELTRENEHLERVVQTLEERIDVLAQALVAARDGPTRKPGARSPRPAIY